MDSCHRQVVDCFLQRSTSARQQVLPCTQGTVHQARLGEAVGVPQAGSSPHHPGSVPLLNPQRRLFMACEETPPPPTLQLAGGPFNNLTRQPPTPNSHLSFSS
ncbi:unnamed protein product [Pleuronectes platessa]|uniref:Uncharacterized protein n=1 Tax=Pleuronectes platessa TaxID=8262 RepID=A0A9N7V8H4_PLEPL|nr:unnamed protein product [Pleuronectes platessa]